MKLLGLYTDPLTVLRCRDRTSVFPLIRLSENGRVESSGADAPGGFHAILNTPFSTTERTSFFADAQHDSYWGEHKYNGPATSPGKVWAGVGGRPPLMVEVRGMTPITLVHS